MHINAGQVNVVGIERAGFHQLFHFYHGDAAGGGGIGMLPARDAQELAAARACGLVMTLPEVMTDAMEQLGIDLPSYVPGRPYEMSMPASFLIDSKGKIIYSFVDEDFRHRAEPEALLSALQLLQPGN